MEQQRKLKRSRSWLKEEDDKLCAAVNGKSKENWNSVARNAGLKRSGNSCRLRWFNHLKPGYRPGRLTDEEKLLILEFRSLFGKNCWARIRAHLLPGRTDNDIKNFWHTLAKRAKLEKCDVDSEALVKKAELVEKITAAGKFSRDYSLLISNDAYTILNTLLPGLAVAGGSAVAASSSSAAYIGSADAVLSPSADLGPPMEVPHEFPNPFCGSHILPENALLKMGTAQGGHQNEWLQWLLDDGGNQITPTRFNQVAVASLSISNDTGYTHNSYGELDGVVEQWGPASGEATAARV